MKNLSTLQSISIYGIFFVTFGILANWFAFFKYAFFVVFAIGVVVMLYLIYVGIKNVVKEYFGK